MEVIRNSPAGRSIVQNYRGGGFTVSGVRHVGPVLVLPAETISWPASSINTLDRSELAAKLSTLQLNLCIIGCGTRMERVPADLRSALKDVGIGVDAMETGAACRTFNMLVGEGRAVAAVLIPLT